MKKILILIVLCITALSTNAIADDEQMTAPYYLGINFSRFEFLDDEFSMNFNPTAIVGKIGYCPHKNFAIEGRAGFGLEDGKEDILYIDAMDTINVIEDVKLKIDHLFGLYGKGIIDVSEKIEIYGLLGITYAKATAKLLGESESENDTGLSYGFGIDFELTDRLLIGIEYMNYLPKSLFDLNAISIGITKYF